MKIIVTGSLGHISKPLVIDLVQKGHTVTVISSKANKQKDVEALGANAAIGSLQDLNFLTTIFKGADAAYCMIPPANYFAPGFDLEAYTSGLVNNYATAIRNSGLKRIVNLSSIGAHLQKGNGIISLYYRAESILSALPGVAITFMRPVGFYYNLLGFIPMIKNQGFIAANYGADENLVWVSPIDIAASIAEELETVIHGKKVRYVASDELTGHETAHALGAAIGKAGLEWKLISNEQMEAGLISYGMDPKIAAGLVEMFAAQHSGLLMEDYYQHKPALGKIKIEDFAKEFAIAYNEQ